MSRVSLSIELDVSAGLPTEFRIFPAGSFETTKGTFLFDAQAARKVMAAVSDWGNDYCIDYGHSMLSFFTVDPAKALKAAGWFTPVMRNGELVATAVRWNEEAASMLTKREVRYVSPAFNTDDGEENRISELVNVALTNIPATKKQPSLVASRAHELNRTKEPKMSKKKLSSYMLYKLGLPPDADDSTVLGAVDRLQEDKRKAEEELLAHAQVEARAKAEAAKKKKIEEGEPDLPTLVVKAVADATETERTRADSERRLNDLTGMKTYGESLGVVLLWKESVVEAERLRARIAELEQKGHGATAEALVEQGIRENKISPAQREYWLAIGKKDPEMLRGYLKSASTVVPKKTAVQPDVKPMVAITEEQKRVAAKLGITDPKALEKISEQMAETQALRAGAA